MSRKELLKKSLGITEYPWSSDEEDTGSAPTVSEAHVFRRQTSEPRTSVADMPGTSGAGQQAPTSPTLSPTRRNQAKMERDLFFSILNNPHKIGTIGIPRSRLSDISSLKYVSPLSWPPAVHTPPSELRERSERPSAAADLQRILPYKKLMRSLNTLRTAKSNSNLYAMSSRGPSRNPLFTPSASTDAGPARTARVHCVLKRLQAGRSGVRWDSAREWDFGPSSSASSSETAAAVRSVLPPTSPPPQPTQPPPASWMDEPVVVDEATPSDHGDDVMELPENMDSPQPAGEEFAAPDQEPIDVDTSNSTSGGGAGVSLEEEIVEIDPPDDCDGEADVDVNVVGDETDNVVTADVGLNEAAPAPTNDETVIVQPQTQETTKKKRDENASRDEGEPYTVKEFNQSLLRLLECPVCLEWMEPPMSQCRRGHLVCGRCRARLAACPVCRTTFSSVRNRAMEGVAEMVRYPCRHGCAREVRLRRRAAHEASCAARRYRCPAPACAERPPLPRDLLPHHFQSKHMSILKIGTQHKFSLKVNSEHHDTWLITALHEYFYMRLDVDIRTWGVIVYVAYIGPKCNAKNFTYQVSVTGQHNSRKLVYCRVTHSDLENSALNVSRQDCFHLTLDQALNFIRFKNRHCEADKFLDFDLEINQIPVEARDDSES